MCQLGKSSAIEVWVGGFLRGTFHSRYFWCFEDQIFFCIFFVRVSSALILCGFKIGQPPNPQCDRGGGWGVFTWNLPLQVFLVFREPDIFLYFFVRVSSALILRGFKPSTPGISGASFQVLPNYIQIRIYLTDRGNRVETG